MNGANDTEALIDAHWRASEAGDLDAEHDIYAPGAVLDYPQSGERFRGRDRIRAQRGGHPADRHFAVRRILGHGDLWISECVITYDGSPAAVVSIMEFVDGHVVHETQYFADPFPPEPRRADLAERIVDADGRTPARGASSRRPDRPPAPPGNSG